MPGMTGLDIRLDASSSEEGFEPVRECLKPSENNYPAKITSGISFS